MTELVGRERLAKLIAQLDQSGAAREAALNGIEAHLRKNGQKFVDLAEALMGPQPQPSAKEQTPARQSNPKEPLKGPYIHEPLFKPRIFGKRIHNGKPVISNVRPPKGTEGRLRVLKDEESYGIHKLTMSLETKHELYEPFVGFAKENDDSYSAIVVSSCNGNPAVF